MYVLNARSAASAPHSSARDVQDRMYNIVSAVHTHTVADAG